jgi:hypothetical protein
MIGMHFRVSLGSFIVAALRWLIVWSAVLFVRVHRPFRMVGCIFDTLHRSRLHSLSRIREFFYRCFAGIGFAREPLRIA